MSDPVTGTEAHSGRPASTRTSAIKRAAREFSASALPQLQQLLAAMPEAQAQDCEGTAWAAYRQYYGLVTPARHQVAALNSSFAVPGQNSSQERVIAQCFTPAEPRGWVLLCHGYYDHVGVFAQVINALLDRHLGVACFDQPGHGLSSGERACTDDFGQYVQVLQDVRSFSEAGGWEAPSGQAPDLCSHAPHLLAQSMGGAVAMELLQRAPHLSWGDVVLLAPLVQPYAWGVNRWVFWIAKHTIESRPRTVTDNSNDPHFARFSQFDPLQPRVLPVRWVQAMVNWQRRFVNYPPSSLRPYIVQGRADRTVSAKVNAKVLGKRFADARWLWLPNGRHHLANESEAVRAKIWTWLDEQGALGTR